MGTIYADLLVDYFLYSYEAEFIQNLLKRQKEKALAKFLYFNFRHIDNNNNLYFSQYLHFIYPIPMNLK